MKYAYPAIFTPLSGGEYDVRVPDLPGCGSCGKGLAEAIYMAEDAVSMWLWDAEIKREKIPAPSASLETKENQFVNFVAADTDEYRRKHDRKTVRRNITLPAWLDAAASSANINVSRIAQTALIHELQIAE